MMVPPMQPGMYAPQRPRAVAPMANPMAAGHIPAIQPMNAAPARVKQAPSAAATSRPVAPETVQISQPTQVHLHGAAKANPYVSNAEAESAARQVTGPTRQRDVWGSNASEVSTAPAPQQAVQQRAPDAARSATKNSRSSLVQETPADIPSGSVSSLNRAATKQVKSATAGSTATLAKPASRTASTGEAPPPKPPPPIATDDAAELNLHSNTRAVNITKGSDGFGFVIRGHGDANSSQFH